MRLIALLTALCLCLTPALADDPIWVDGNGNMIGAPTDPGGNTITPEPVPIPTPVPEDFYDTPTARRSGSTTPPPSSPPGRSSPWRCWPWAAG